MGGRRPQLSTMRPRSPSANRKPVVPWANGAPAAASGSEIMMDYVALLRFRSSVSGAERDAALARRGAWQHPTGIRLTAEYWPMAGDVQVVSIFSTDDIAAIMEFQFEWSDVFDIDVTPAVSAEEGLRIGPEVFGRLTRLQQ